MKRVAKAVFRFLPVQLVLLHFRKYQLLLVFWLILIATVTGHFAATFGAATLFLSPEYLGKINFTSMFLGWCYGCICDGLAYYHLYHSQPARTLYGRYKACISKVLYQ